MSSRKPTLALSTPVTASFPAEALKSAASVRTPQSALWRDPLLSAGLASAGLPSAGLPSAGLNSACMSPLVAIKTEEGLLKTPISPPIAYMDFLRLNSPVAPSPSKPNASAQSNLAPATGDAATSTSAGAVSPRRKVVHRASISGPPRGISSARAQKRAAAAAVATAAAAAAAAEVAAGSSASSDDDVSSSNDSIEDKDAETDSTPSTARSMSSTASDDCSCHCEQNAAAADGADVLRSRKSPKIARIDTTLSASPVGGGNNSAYPMSAPAFGNTSFPSLKIPVSPAVANAAAAGASQVNSPIRTPFSAKSTTMVSAFDWEAALKARYAEFKTPLAAVAQKLQKQQPKQQPKPSANGSTAAATTTSSPPPCTKCSQKSSSGNKPVTAAAAAAAAAKPATPATTSASTSTSTSTSLTTTKESSSTPPTSAAATAAHKASNIRHIREVVTRTVTYTPRMHPAPKGKKRKIECDEATC